MRKSRSVARRAAHLLAALALAILYLQPAHAQEGEPRIVRIGVLAHRGWTEQQAAWQPLADYLETRLDGRVAQLVPVTLTSAGPLINAGGLDFLVTNPGHYIDLARTYPMSVLSTRKRRLSDGSFATQFGSAVVVRADSDLLTLTDLKGARVGAVSPHAFGGFQIAWFEAREQGVDLLADPTDLVFLGFPQDDIVQSVLAGDIQAGIIRSGLLERLEAEGSVAPGSVRVLNANVTYTYPEAVSSRLYPEWPFLALASTPADLRDAVALALLQSADSGLPDLWGAPVSYHDARALVQSFADRPDAASASSDRLSLPLWMLIAMASAFLALLAAVSVRRRHRQRGAEPARDTARDKADEVPLTRRESQVLTQIGEGRSTKEIAATLGISPKTVEFHRTNLLRKFDARSSAQLIALSRGQFHPPDSET